MSKTTLKRSLKDLHKGSGRTKVIAVAGVSTGVGVTHTALLLANFLRRYRLKVAFVEMNPSGHLARIEKAYEGMGFDTATTTNFVVKQVTYHKNRVQNQLPALYQQNYDVVIVDLGSDFHQHAETFQLADYPLMVGQLTDWKRPDIDGFIIRYNQWLSDRTRWVLPFASPRDVKEFSRRQDSLCLALPFTGDPFASNKTIHQQLAKLFH